MVNYLSQLIPNEAERNLLLALIHAKVYKQEHNQAKIVWYGPGSNGKTTFRRLLQNLYPEALTFSEDDLESQQADFYLTSLKPNEQADQIVINFPHIFNGDFNMEDHLAEVKAAIDQAI